MIRSPFALLALLSVSGPSADDGDRLLSVDRYVRVRSTVPAIAGQTAQLHVREVVRAASVLREGTLADHVVLFVHGAGTPGEVGFDIHYEDYSWMAYVAHAGLDVFANTYHEWPVNCHGHDGLWPLDPTRGDERSLQSLSRSADRVHAGAAPGWLRADLPEQHDHNRV
jgi:hypothetical protein